MMTCFVRIVVVLSLLRTAIGIQQSPPNAVMVSLALFLTLFVMAPTFEQVYRQAVDRSSRARSPRTPRIDKAAVPMKTFMLAHTRESDLALFIDMARVRQAGDARGRAVRRPWCRRSCCRN